MTDIYDLPAGVATAMSGSLGEGDAVQLPFSAALFWAVNGDQRLAQQKGVPYFGGWAADRDEFEAHAAADNFAIPSSLQLVEFTGDNGTYSAYTSRALGIAPIVYRKRNASREPGKFRSHIQLLGVGMITADKQRVSLGPVVLTAKGYQASNIVKAFGAWEKASAEVRRTNAKGTDAKFFYVPIGTFGPEPKFVSVGKAQQSKITPIEPQIPEQITDEILRGRYVGQELAQRMAEMREMAKDWVADWKEHKDEQPQEIIPPDNFEEDAPF